MSDNGNTFMEYLDAELSPC